MGIAVVTEEGIVQADRDDLRKAADSLAPDGIPRAVIEAHLELARDDRIYVYMHSDMVDDAVRSLRESNTIVEDGRAPIIGREQGIGLLRDMALQQIGIQAATEALHGLIDSDGAVARTDVIARTAVEAAVAEAERRAA